MEAVRSYHEINDQMDPSSLFPKFAQAGFSAHTEMMNGFSFSFVFECFMSLF